MTSYDGPYSFVVDIQNDLSPSISSTYRYTSLYQAVYLHTISYVCIPIGVHGKISNYTDFVSIFLGLLLSGSLSKPYRSEYSFEFCYTPIIKLSFCCFLLDFPALMSCWLTSCHLLPHPPTTPSLRASKTASQCSTSPSTSLNQFPPLISTHQQESMYSTNISVLTNNTHGACKNFGSLPSMFNY